MHYFAILELTGKVRRMKCDPRDIERERGNGTVIAHGVTEQERERILAKDPNGKADWS